MTSTLEKLREKLENEAFDKATDRGFLLSELSEDAVCSPQTAADIAVETFDAALRALSEAAGEFDQREAEGAELHTSGDMSRAIIFAQGARWQFEQDRARIGLAESAEVAAMQEYTSDEKENK